MNWELVIGCGLIFVARLFDVSLDTLRMIAVIRGRRGWAWVFGFVQVLIWIYAISYAMKNITQPVYAVTYALGFACGNFLGITIEGWLAHGDQVIRVFTKPEFADAMAARLRGHGYGVTIFDGRGKDGAVSQLYVESSRKRVSDAAKLCRSMDPECFYVIDDVRAASTASGKPRGEIRPVTEKDLAGPPIAGGSRSVASAHAGAASGGAAK
jgi:uncharacterized protein YebE (UPF0316 family)